MISLLPLLIVSAVSTDFPYTWVCNSTAYTCTRQLKGAVDDFTPVSKCKLECVSGEDDAGGTRVLWPRPRSIENIDKTTSVINVDNIEYLGNIYEGDEGDIDSELRGVADEDLKELFDLFKTKFAGADVTADTVDCSFVYNVTDGNKSADLQLDTSEEGYTLEIIPTGEGPVSRLNINVTAKTYFGARHALETLSQLILYGPIDKNTYITNGIKIEDSPAYPWRGISVDTSRNYISPTVIKTIIQGLAAAKLNTFHWHLTDSHSFPFESASYPNMSIYGAYLPSKTYSVDVIKDIVEYAKKLGVRVVPELDAPAHAGYGWQWGKEMGLGDLVVCLNEKPWENYCLEPPCGQMNVVNDNLYIVLKALYSDLRSAFGSDWFHMGGDEVKWECWDTDQTIIDFMETKGWSRDAAGYMELWQYYQDKAYTKYAELTDSSPKVILWSSHMTMGEDLLRLDKDKYVIQYWGSTEDEEHKEQLRNLIERGYRVIMSNYNQLYLDCGFGAWIGNGNSNWLNWCSPYKSWHQMYRTNIQTWLKRNYGIEETVSSKLILGGETAIWTEQAGDNDILARIFPRTWAYAERLWTNPVKGGTCPQDHPNVYYNGDYCCEHDEEKYYEPQGELCDNGPIGFDSVCCKNDDNQQCSDPPCSDYEGSGPGDLGTWQEAEGRLLYFTDIMKHRGVSSNTMQPEYCNQNDGTCVLDSSSSSVGAIYNTVLLALAVLLTLTACTV